jgi:hypothetical protein
MLNQLKLHRQKIILVLVVLLVVFGLFSLTRQRTEKVENTIAQDPSTGITIIVNELIFYDIEEEALKNAVAEYEGELRRNSRDDLSIHAVTFPVDNINELRTIKNDLSSRGLRVSFNALNFE